MARWGGYPLFKRAKSCRTACCACRSRKPACNNGKHPPRILRTGRAKALRRSAKGDRCLKVPGLSTHGTVGGLQLVFPEIGRAPGRAKEYSGQKNAVAATSQASK